MAAWSDNNSEQQKSNLMSPLQNDAILPAQLTDANQIDESAKIEIKTKKELGKNSKSPKGKDKGHLYKL